MLTVVVRTKCCCIRETFQLFVKCLLCQSRPGKNIQNKTRHCILHFHRNKKSVSLGFLFYSVATHEIIQTTSVESICTMSIQSFNKWISKKKEKKMNRNGKKNLMINEWICIFEVNPIHIRNANGWYIVKWFVLTSTWPSTQIEKLNETTKHKLKEKKRGEKKCDAQIGW